MIKDKKLYHREWTAKNPEKIQASRLRYRLKNPQKMKEANARWRAKNKEQQRLYYKHYRQTPRFIFGKYRKSANIRGYLFQLSFDDFKKLISLKKCHYCGAEGRVGLDRVVNQEGYTMNNVVPCCWPCNRFKSKLSGSQFISLCIAIAKNHTKF